MEIVSIHLGQEKAYEYFTIGMHPWWTVQPVTSSQREKIEALLSEPACLALGEIGLDNLKGPAMNQQMDILRSLLSIAEKQEKPVIIHCVRAFDQLNRIKKEFLGIRNWCIHGYSRHATLARQLIEQGYYLSLMPQIPNPKFDELLREIPIDRLFLETDSMPSSNIRDVYQRASQILNIEIADLCRQINENAKTFFGK